MTAGQDPETSYLVRRQPFFNVDRDEEISLQDLAERVEEIEAKVHELRSK